ncbi:hypothetical protein BCR44DRAFT_350740 [Catenaria anguillulae PL171]|uniref:Disease resistance R13L4/SHOC-2-like LRR domain-containing protein n=1 Tax=Catenaria anguillulae PL171 TaxID=765915 RepID=A0A1Y2HDE9_9FUNG|nr:hypothetical protein BCR44DRAFT_350740 [Catenaria anguillulae PL171]
MAAFSPPQCSALRRALESLGMPDLQSLLSSGQSCCDWRNFVTCNPAYQIIGLKLVSQGLTGRIPRVLGQLTDLEKLDLSGNFLTGTIPDELRDLGKLRELHIVGDPSSDQRLSGELPSALRDLTKLEKINLSNQQFNGTLQAFSNIDSLEELHLYHNGFTGPIPDNIGEARNLEELELGFNKLYGSIPESLSKLNSLSTLKLNNNKLNGTIPKLPIVAKTCELVADSSGRDEGNNFCKSPNITSPETHKCLTELQRRRGNLATCPPPPPPARDQPAPAQPAVEPSGGTPTLTIVGIVVGVLALLAVAVFVMMRRRRRGGDDKQRDVDVSTIESKPTPQHPVTAMPAFPASIADNPPRMTFIVDAHGNRHSIHLPSHVAADGSQFILVQQAPPPLPSPAVLPPQSDASPSHGDMRLARPSITSDPSSLASSTHQPIFIMHPHGSAVGNATPVVPMPPVPSQAFFPNELVYLGDDPRASMSTVATTTTMATDKGAALADDVGTNDGQIGKSTETVTVPPPVSTAGGEGVVREAMAEQPVSMVTVNVPDGYTVSLVPIGRPQTPVRVGSSEAESARSHSFV